MRHQVRLRRWAVLWRQKNKLDGKTQHFIRDRGEVALFRTRQKAREWSKKLYVFIKDRPDLRAEPHGWKMPKVVPVTVTVATE